jgi:hypothetical protein
VFNFVPQVSAEAPTSGLTRVKVVVVVSAILVLHH